MNAIKKTALVATLIVGCIQTSARADEPRWKTIPSDLAKELFELATPDDSEDNVGKIGENRSFDGECDYIAQGSNFELTKCFYSNEGSDGWILDPLADQFSDYLLSNVKPVVGNDIAAIRYTCQVMRTAESYEASCNYPKEN